MGPMSLVAHQYYYYTQVLLLILDQMPWIQPLDFFHLFVYIMPTKIRKIKYVQIIH